MFCNICCFVRKWQQRWNNWRVSWESVWGLQKGCLLSGCLSRKLWLVTVSFWLCCARGRIVTTFCSLYLQCIIDKTGEKSLRKILRMCDLMKYLFMFYWLLVDYEYKKLFSNLFFFFVPDFTIKCCLFFVSKAES